MELPLPRNAIEFDDLYRDEEACIQALVDARTQDDAVLHPFKTAAL